MPDTGQPTTRVAYILDKIQPRYLRTQREDPDGEPRTLFAGRNIEDEPEPLPGLWNKLRNNSCKKKQ